MGDKGKVKGVPRGPQERPDPQRRNHEDCEPAAGRQRQGGPQGCHAEKGPTPKDKPEGSVPVDGRQRKGVSRWTAPNINTLGRKSKNILGYVFNHTHPTIRGRNSRMKLQQGPMADVGNLDGILSLFLNSNKLA